MDTIPFPQAASLDEYAGHAQDLLEAVQTSDPSALHAWAVAWFESSRDRLGVALTPFVRDSIARAVAHLEESARARLSPHDVPHFTIDDAQRLIAEAHSFADWGIFARHLLAASATAGNADPFERAADAVVSGELGLLTRLLDEHPALARARSERTHRATLLHYVAANGVEDFRQRSPRNAAEVARRLLERGAEVDAASDSYDGGLWQTTMNLLVSSVHPHAAGVQAALVDVLCDYGAAVNGVADDESPLFTALEFGYPDAAAALVWRGARVDNVLTASATGRLDLVMRFVVDARTLAPDVPLLAPHWRALPPDAARHIAYALVYACRYGREDVARFLLERGVDPAAADGQGMSALHWSAANGLANLVRTLLERGAPLEARNTWGGTVLSSTVHFAVHMPVAGVDYPAMLEQLIGAGADVHQAYPSESVSIDGLLRRHGAGSA